MNTPEDEDEKHLKERLEFYAAKSTFHGAILVILKYLENKNLTSNKLFN
jgi:hypothetical protein